VSAPRAASLATRELILNHALRLAAAGGLPAASIGALASATGMAKSGVFLHFGSKPALDEALVQTASARFERAVVTATAAAPGGVARLVALSEAWLELTAARDAALDVLAAGCPPLRVAPRDALGTWHRGWRALLLEHAAGAAAAGELPAATRADVIAFEIDALLRGAWHDTADGDASAVARARYAIEHALRRWAAAEAP